MINAAARSTSRETAIPTSSAAKTAPPPSMRNSARLRRMIASVKEPANEPMPMAA
jgi:hypothetical protein